MPLTSAVAAKTLDGSACAIIAQKSRRVAFAFQSANCPALTMPFSVM